MRESNLVEMIKAACMACAIPVLLYLAFAISVYGDTVDANGSNLSGGGESRHAATLLQPALGQGNAQQSGLSTCVSESSASPAQNISPAELYARLIDERYIPWTEPAILKGNSFADRMSESQ